MEEGKAAKEGGFVYTFQVADETGTVITTLWNEVGQSTKVGDIILMVGGYSWSIWFFGQGSFIGLDL